MEPQEDNPMTGSTATTRGDTERGQEFMKRIIKASLAALFAIGVTSSKNIDKFINHFNEELLKNYPNEPVAEPSPPVMPTPEALQSPTTPPKEEVDISVPGKET